MISLPYDPNSEIAHVLKHCRVLIKVSPGSRYDNLLKAMSYDRDQGGYGGGRDEGRGYGGGGGESDSYYDQGRRE
jgi:hypothetical protein